MDKLRIYRLPLTILLVGLFIRIIGGMMTIMHWPANFFVLWLGTGLMLIAIIILLVRIWQVKRS